MSRLLHNRALLRLYPAVRNAATSSLTALHQNIVERQDGLVEKRKALLSLEALLDRGQQ